MGQGDMARVAIASGTVANGGKFRELSVGHASCLMEKSCL